MLRITPLLNDERNSCTHRQECRAAVKSATLTFRTFNNHIQSYYSTQSHTIVPSLGRYIIIKSLRSSCLRTVKLIFTLGGPETIPRLHFCITMGRDLAPTCVMIPLNTPAMVRGWANFVNGWAKFYVRLCEPSTVQCHLCRKVTTPDRREQILRANRQVGMICRRGCRG